MRYSPELTYVKGLHHNAADALLLSPIGLPAKNDIEFVGEVEEFKDAMISNLPASDCNRLREIKEAQANDAICAQLAQYC